MQRVMILLIATCLWAEGSVNVTVDRHRIDEGDSMALTVTAKNVSSDPDVILPKIPDFKVVSGPNQSSSTNVQFINGKMTKNATTIPTSLHKAVQLICNLFKAAKDTMYVLAIALASFDFCTW